MKWVCALVLLDLTAALSLADPPAKAKSTAPASTKVTAGHHAKRRLTHALKPSYQSHPDPERYQEIQKALAEKGYFKGEVNGTWGDDSIEALQRFQTDQKLPNDGKISALTLMGLGLGPKHDGSAVTPVGAPAAGSVPIAQPALPPASEAPPGAASAPQHRPPGLF